ncbi:MAG TPA: CHAT domain-containing protein, partial [Thermoanaerobaculia bacterium]|nr:CHAT domain-containing protein [Thermoanaerobaculia bacterium]
EQAVRVAANSQLPSALSDSDFSLGIAYWVANRLPEAVAALRRSASYAGQVDDPRLPLRALYMAAHLELRQNNLREALELAAQHDRLLALYPSRRAAIDSAFQSALIHEALGNLEVTRQKQESILPMARQVRDPGLEAIALFNLAPGEATDDPFESIRRIEEALALGKEKLSGEQMAAMRLSLAERLREAGDLERADETLAAVIEAARASDERNLLAGAYSGRSRLRLLQGRLEDALSDAREGRRIAQAEGATGRSRVGLPLLETLIEEGRALRALGRREEADATWRMAVDTVEIELAEQGIDEMGGATHLEGKLAPYRELLSLYAEDGCVREALVVAERMRARALRDSLRHGRLDFSAGLDEATRRREIELQNVLAEVNRALLLATDPAAVTQLQRDREQARLALRQFRREIYATHPEISQRRADTLDQDGAWAPFVPKDEVVLELAVGADRVLLFILEGTSIGLKRIEISKDELEKRVGDFVAALETRDLRYRQRARALYDLLLGPVAAPLSKARSVRIVPDGPLWRLPFHALIDAGGKHLIERLPVSYAPSLVLSHRPPGGRAPRRALLAFANPAVAPRTAQSTRALVRDADLGDLPEAVTEARAIARLYEDAEVRIGTAARESVFKRDAAEFRVLHLAAHSIVDDGAPMFSSILLAAPGVATASAGSLEDGLLEAHEIADLRLRADLAVLSACETARGRVTPGEGMVGLSWAFMAAGVPVTVVSQWKVGSASTAALMVHFHKSLRGGQPPAAALRMAMIDLRRNERWRHPFYWAPFVVMESVSGDVR